MIATGSQAAIPPLGAGVASDMRDHVKTNISLIPQLVDISEAGAEAMHRTKDANEIKVVYRRDVAGYGVLTPVYPPNHSK